MSHRDSIVKISSVTAKDQKNGTVVNIIGIGRIPEFLVRTLDSPPRIIVDILDSVPSFESVTVPVKSRALKSVRVGSHEEKIRLVLDLKGTDVPVFTTMSEKNRLTIFLKSLKPRSEKKRISPKEKPPIKAPPQKKENPDSKKEAEAKAKKGKGGKVQTPRDQSPIGTGDKDGAAEDPKKKGDPDRITRPGKRGISTLEKTIGAKADDGQADTAFLLNGYKAYRSKNWGGAIESLTNLINEDPEGRYSEYAHFLLARSFKNRYSHDLETNFTKIKTRLEDAIYRFPNSEHVPEARLALGNLSFEIKNYFEALAYYNLVIKQHPDAFAARHAFLQKARVLRLQKKKMEAISVLEITIDRYRGSPAGTEAMVEMATILYEINSFQKSLQILNEIKADNPDSLYKYPQISLFLGYNYEQMGKHREARENLFWFYNLVPKFETNHLVLTKIADAYRDEGLTEDAVKIYKLVLERFLDSEGALISQIRLAEQQEKGELRVQGGIARPVRIIDRVVGLPKEIYQDIIKTFINEKKANPLAQLALLKLAILYQKEKDYDRSLKALKELLEKYPWTSLKKETRHTLVKTLTAILQGELEKKRYINLANIYGREKKLFEMMNSPDPFLTTARAFIHLDLEGTAAKLFKKADSLLNSKDKPPDLLFFMGRDFYKKARPKSALARFDFLIERHPTNLYAPDAYHLKGKILFSQKKYSEAADMFSSALKYPLKRCKQVIVLIDKAKALMENRSNDEALAAAHETDRIKRGCFLREQYIFEELGDIYLRLGHPKVAIDQFNQALESESEGEAKIVLKLKIARSYRRLNRKGDYLALYEQISSLNDPFWSNLSKERIEEIRFDSVIKDAKKNR